MTQKMAVYVLALEHGKFYVGYTENWETRKQQHFEGNGSVWTSLHRPIAVVSTEEATQYTEISKTREMMMTHGIDNVRGGPWCTVEIDDATRAHLQLEYNAAHNLCYKCSSPDHKAAGCPGPKSDIAASLWTTLDKGYGDSVLPADGNLLVSFSGQRDGKSDDLVKEGALFCYRATSADDWIVGGRVTRVDVIQSKIPRRFSLIVSPIDQSSSRYRGKSATCRAVGAQIPSRDKWEMAGIVAH
jgi:predicted GIY-YIG superfamily endonuclease